jgi:hypothetical protein
METTSSETGNGSMTDTEGSLSYFMEVTQSQIHGFLPQNIILYHNHGFFGCLH